MKVNPPLQTNLTPFHSKVKTEVSSRLNSLDLSLLCFNSPNNSDLHDRAIAGAGSSWHGAVGEQLAGGPGLLHLRQGEARHRGVVCLGECSGPVDALVDTVGGSCCYYISK